MKLFGLLRKPAWENKDAAIRLRAVQSSQDAPLLSKLVELAQTDPEPAVRIAALRRVDDPALLERRLRGEHDTGVANAARERLIECLCAAGTDFDTGSAVLLQSHDAELLLAIAERSPLPALRKLALERSDKPSLWLQRCIHDPDPALRLWLLQKIDAPDALQKIADAARKRDKRLTRAARDKLEALQLASGDGAALQRHVLALCEQFGRLGRELPADRDQKMAALRSEWQQVRERADADLQRRADGSMAMAEAALAAARGEPIPDSATATEAAESAQPTDVDAAQSSVTASASVTLPEATSEPPAQPEPELDRLLASLPAADAEDLEQQLAQVRAAAERHPAHANPLIQAQQERLSAALATLARERREQQSARLLAAANGHLERLQQALQEGSLNAAREARQALSGKPPRELQRRLAEADEQLAKLERWQRWSGSKVRSRLCDEAEALHGSGIHPDALANKVKELQAEWARLDALEGAAAPGPEHGLTRRFRGLCHRALAPARPYFEKRRELRGERSEQIAALIAEAGSLPEDAAALQALRKRVRDALPELEDASPEKRGEQGRLLRERLAAIDAALRALREQAALGKQRVIARLRRDLGSADPLAAIELAKAAQLEWKRLPRSERAQEDALWTELRGLIDPLFERVREQDDAARARSAEADAAARAILDELDALASAAPERLLHANAWLEGLQTRWRALSASVEPSVTSAPVRGARDGQRRDGRDAAPRGGRRDGGRPAPRQGHPLDDRFEAASARVLAAQREAQRQREREQLAAICAAGALLDRMTEVDAEQRDSLAKEFQQLDLPADARNALGERLRVLLSGAAEAPADAQEAERLAVRAELAAGLPSPDHVADLRKHEQMQRLAARMAGQPGAEPRAAIRALLIELQSLPGVPSTQRVSLQERLLQAFREVDIPA